MKAMRFVLSTALLLLAASAFAQSDAEKSFEKLKTLAGTWEATIDGKPLQVTLRVTSMGNTLMHEMKTEGGLEDPVTMFYLNGDQLFLTHFCDAGNQPRMVGKALPDGKTFEFLFLDITNFSSTQIGHMQRAVFTMVDANHHIEDWTFVGQDGKPSMQGHLDLHRVK